MKQKILITSALLYANGSLHFGHLAGSYLPADCYAKMMRFCGHDVLFVSGLDEYGAAITLSAEKEKRSPKKHVDYYFKEALKNFERFNFSYDHFSRTTWSKHADTVINFFDDLRSSGYVEKQKTEQLYSEKDGKFLADRYVVGTCPKCGYDQARGDECPKCGASFEASDLLSPKSKITQAPLVLKETEHHFLRLDKLKEPVKSWLKKKNWRPQVKNMALKYAQEARARCITRDLNWGIPVPGEPGKVFYVWFDAPIGYISATQDWAEKIGDVTAWEKYWLDPETKYVQFVGKDNIPFHSVFFPAMIFGQKTAYKQVDDLPANAFFHYEGKKFSKSDGWYIDLDRFFEAYSSDQIRYCLAANAPEQGDSEFCWKDFQMRCNAELVGKLGNFINRTLVFIFQKADATLPQLKQISVRSQQFLDHLNECALQIKNSYETYHLRRATQQIMEMASLCNSYFDEMKPWELFKSDRQKMNEVLACCVEGIKCLAICSYPVIPEGAAKIWAMLNQGDEIIDKQFDERLNQPICANRTIEKPKILFQKIEDEQIKQELSMLHQNETQKESSSVSFDDFSQLQFKVAEIIEASELPKSKKLLKIKLDLGDEQRQVVSGIKEHYSPENLIGKKVILVANLKPAKIMGVESQGMILAASTEDQLELPFIEKLPPGSQVS